MRGCYVDGCDGTHYAKDYCRRHYMRWLRYGAAEPAAGRMSNPDGSSALLERMEGLASYRQIDYWIRTGSVDLPHLANLGSGRRRVFTEPEQMAIIAYAEEVRDIDQRDTALRDGSFFRNALAETEREFIS